MKRYICLLLAVIFIFGSCSMSQPKVSPDIDPENPNLPEEASASATEPAEQWKPAAPFSDSSETEDDTAKASEAIESSEQPTAEESSEAPPLTQRLVIPEGYTLARIGMTLEEIGIMDTKKFIEATEAGDFSEFPLISSSGKDPKRAFQLEGYLYPDTYEIYTKETADSIIRRMLSNTEAKVSGEMRKAIEKSEFTAHEIFTLASIIEKEAFRQEEMPRISSVLHNRMDIGMKLQCDVTIVYVEGAIKPFIEGDENRYNDSYNTYKAAALPPGPICNPSVDALWAALEPETTDYLYFITDADKNFYYTDDFEEHDAWRIEFGIGSSTDD